MEPITWAAAGAVGWEFCKRAYSAYAERRQDRVATQRKLLHEHIGEACQCAESALEVAHAYFSATTSEEKEKLARSVVHETKLLGVKLQSINGGLSALSIRETTVSEMIAFRQALTIGTEDNHGGQSPEQAMQRIYNAHHSLHVALCSLRFKTS